MSTMRLYRLVLEKQKLILHKRFIPALISIFQRLSLHEQDMFMQDYTIAILQYCPSEDIRFHQSDIYIANIDQLLENGTLDCMCLYQCLNHVLCLCSCRGYEGSNVICLQKHTSM